MKRVKMDDEDDDEDDEAEAVAEEESDEQKAAKQAAKEQKLAAAKECGLHPGAARRGRKGRRGRRREARRRLWKARADYDGRRDTQERRRRADEQAAQERATSPAAHVPRAKALLAAWKAWPPPAASDERAARARSGPQQEQAERAAG